MSTVGYGDIRPSTALGKLCASCFCIFGVVLIALPISVISANFKKIFFEYETASYEASEDDDMRLDNKVTNPRHLLRVPPCHRLLPTPLPPPLPPHPPTPPRRLYPSPYPCPHSPCNAAPSCARPRGIRPPGVTAV